MLLDQEQNNASEGIATGVGIIIMIKHPVKPQSVRFQVVTGMDLVMTVIQGTEKFVMVIIQEVIAANTLMKTLVGTTPIIFVIGTQTRAMIVTQQIV